jgi:hypothetical protein
MEAPPIGAPGQIRERATSDARPTASSLAFVLRPELEEADGDFVPRSNLQAGLRRTGGPGWWRRDVVLGVRGVGGGGGGSRSRAGRRAEGGGTGGDEMWSQVCGA